MIVYMGITPQNFKNLLEHKGKQNITWECSSYDNFVYCYVENEEYEGMVLSDIIWNGIVQATNTKETSIYLVKMNLDDSIIENDFSEPNTDTSYQKCFHSDYFTKDMVLNIVELKFDMCVLYAMINSLSQNNQYVWNSDIYSETEQMFIDCMSFDELYGLLTMLEDSVCLP